MHEPALFLAKARRALASADALLALADADGACNRAYYAMFDAARHALLAEVGPDDGASRTHGGLIAAFGLAIVKPGLLPADHGRALNRANQLRLLADYRGDATDAVAVRDLVAEAHAFVAAVSQRWPDVSPPQP